MRCPPYVVYIFFSFFNDTATTEIYTLSLHDALPISPGRGNSQTILRSGVTSITRLFARSAIRRLPGMTPAAAVGVGAGVVAGTGEGGGSSSACSAAFGGAAAGDDPEQPARARKSVGNS